MFNKKKCYKIRLLQLFLLFWIYFQEGSFFWCPRPLPLTPPAVPVNLTSFSLASAIASSSSNLQCSHGIILHIYVH